MGIVNIDQLRGDLVLTAARDGLSDAEVKEIGASIKAAIDAGDEEALQGWAAQLGWWRETLASFAPRLRAFEAGIKASRVAECVGECAA